MNLFVQGMRRSGTTILHDALLEDPELRCFYEPLREEKVSVGGGSGARDVDAFADTSAIRDDFRRARYPQLAIEQFNWGGPREPALELEPELPEHCLELLRYLLDRGRSEAADTAIKETRLYCKVPVLHELDPGGVLVHVVRDPRAVAASIVLGRGRRRQRKLRTADEFFADRAERKLWSSRAISERLLQRAGYPALDDPSNVERVLIVWRITFEAARIEGMRLFGDRYLLLRNEDLRADPAAALARVYAVLGRPVPDPVSAWAAANVKGPQDTYAGDDPRWRASIERLGMVDAVDEAGYAGLLPS
ncbi:MAG TPA: sulfotransferase [Solirubrobacterales bacterium]|nr:sulfotransferase [Solirubrobacterales bacterium]